MMLRNLSTPICKPVAGQYKNKLACKIKFKYPVTFKSYKDFH